MLTKEENSKSYQLICNALTQNRKYLTELFDVKDMLQVYKQWIQEELKENGGNTTINANDLLDYLQILDTITPNEKYRVDLEKSPIEKNAVSVLVTD